MRIAAIGVAAAVCCHGQAAAPNPGTQQAPANENAQAEACATFSDAAIPVATTIRAKVGNSLDAAHLKPGKKVWVNSVYGMVYAGCTLDPDAAIYGTVTGAASSKSPNASELSLEFSSADCSGHGRQPLKLLVVGVIAPPDELKNSHDATPTELQGIARQISDTAASTNGYDAKLSPGRTPNTIQPGIVLGYKNMKLEPRGGPQCSAKMTSTDRDIVLAPGAILLLAVPATK
jgi:hypothetical protein